MDARKCKNSHQTLYIESEQKLRSTTFFKNLSLTPRGALAQNRKTYGGPYFTEVTQKEEWSLAQIVPKTILIRGSAHQERGRPTSGLASI
jgi:hypothetical protein